MNEAADKQALRRTARQARRRLHGGQAQAGRAIAANFLAGFPELNGNGVVAGFWPFGSEVDCRPLLQNLHDAGTAILLPKVLGAGAPLGFVPWHPEASMNPEVHDILVPEGEPISTPPDALLVPLLAFDRNGHRLGQGGGYYDRTLATLREKHSIQAIGLAYDGQLLEDVPHKSHDQVLDAVVTEQRVYRFTKEPQ